MNIQARNRVAPVGDGFFTLRAAAEEAERRYDRGELASAERLCAEVLAVDARNAQSLHVLGMIAYRRGDFAEAARRFRRALSLDRNNSIFQSNLGGALQAQGRLSEAMVCYRRALSLRPDMAEGHYNLGNAQRDSGLAKQALDSYRRAIALRPDLAEAHYNLGNLLREQGKPEEAIGSYAQAIVCRPNLSEAYTNLGSTLQQLDLLEASLRFHLKALALAPGRAEAHYNVGSVLCALGDAKGAMTAYERALGLREEFADARFGRSLANLLTGEFAQGWKEYGFRWSSTHFETKWRQYPWPVWTGGPLGAGSLLIWKEQGIGDEIMFAGIIPELVRRDMPLVIDCDRRLVSLLARSFPKARVVAGHDAASSGHSAAGDDEVAAHLPIGSLPELFRKDEASFAGTPYPYLIADAVAREEFRKRYGADRLKVGVAWHTRNKTTGKRRSIELGAFAPVIGAASSVGPHWTSLQYGSHDAIEAEARQAGLPVAVDRTVDQLEDIDRFAAQIAALDLVITIDNSTAHLAGALGVRTWVLLPFAADWRWMEGREDSPWYPTVRLFRQPARGDWQSVLLQVRKALAAFTLER